MVVTPVKVFAPDSTQVPLPDLVKEVTPVLSPMMGVRLLEPVLLPSSVSVFAVVSALKPIAPELVKFTAPVPEASIVLDACKEKSRLVLTAVPVYSKVPPLRIKLLAAVDDVPILLLLPPLASVVACSVPALMRVIPP